jgi:hypothetical protein
MTGASRLLAALGLLAASGSLPLSGALADGSPSCTPAPTSRWIPEMEMRVRIETLGYRIDVLRTTKGGCYEIYGRDALGKRVEIYFNPLSGEVVWKSS